MVRGKGKNGDGRCEYAKRGMPSVDPRGALDALVNTFGRKVEGGRSHRRAGRSGAAPMNWAIRIRNRIDSVVQGVAQQEESGLGCTSSDNR